MESDRLFYALVTKSRFLDFLFLTRASPRPRVSTWIDFRFELATHWPPTGHPLATHWPPSAMPSRDDGSVRTRARRNDLWEATLGKNDPGSLAKNWQGAGASCRKSSPKGQSRSMASPGGWWSSGASHKDLRAKVSPASLSVIEQASEHPLDPVVVVRIGTREGQPDGFVASPGDPPDHRQTFAVVEQLETEGPMPLPSLGDSP